MQQRAKSVQLVTTASRPQLRHYHVTAVGTATHQVWRVDHHARRAQRAPSVPQVARNQPSAPRAASQPTRPKRSVHPVALDHIRMAWAQPHASTVLLDRIVRGVPVPISSATQEAIVTPWVEPTRATASHARQAQPARLGRPHTRSVSLDLSAPRRGIRSAPLALLARSSSRVVRLHALTALLAASAWRAPPRQLCVVQAPSHLQWASAHATDVSQARISQPTRLQLASTVSLATIAGAVPLPPCPAQPVCTSQVATS